MESPVIVENCANFATPVQNDETGFPFDDTEYDFEDRLNNIAQRHPELASHLRFDNFPSLRRKRHGFGTSADQNDRFGAGSSSRFSDFNRFPFDRHFEEEFASEPEKNRQEKPPEVPITQDKRGRKPNPNLPQHLSNTVDLGQKQPPVEEVRSQRSMSAPPENRSSQSASKADNDIPPEQEDMGKAQSQQAESSKESTPSQPKERIIPIHIEGRDEVIFPKNTHTHTHHANSGPPPEKVFGGERVHSGFQQQQPQYQQRGQDPFGQQRRQQAYEQFMPHPQTRQFNRQQTPPYQQVPPQQKYYQQAPPQQHYQQPSAAHQQSQQQHAAPQHFQQQQQHKQATPPPEGRPTQQRSQGTPPPSNDPLDKIKCVKNDVLDLMMKVEQFGGTRKDREYLYLDEMLTRNLLKLDDINTEGKENIRSARKEAIKCIQTCINSLEAKAQAKERELKSAEEQNSQTSQETSNQSSEVMQTEDQSLQENEKQTSTQPTFKSEATINLSGAPVNQEKSQETMEVDPKPAENTQNFSETVAQNDAAAPMEIVQDNQQQQQQQAGQDEAVQSNSSQPETTTSK